jgi:hypothetical protein
MESHRMERHNVSLGLLRMRAPHSSHAVLMPADALCLPGNARAHASFLVFFSFILFFLIFCFVFFFYFTLFCSANARALASVCSIA